jgi:hypothetical protein
MKKGRLLALFLGVVLVLSVGQPASAVTIEIGFSGPYSERDLTEAFGIDPKDVPDVVPGQTYDLTFGIDITSELNALPGGPPPGVTSHTQVWLFHAGIADNGVDEKILSFVIDGSPGGHTLISGPQLMKPIPPPVIDDYFSEVAGDGTQELTFTEGTGINECIWFDVHATAIGYTIGAGEINLEPTPVPSALLLLGSGFVGLVGLRRFRRK